MAEDQPVRMVLTPEQRALIQRLSGQNIDAIELTADDAKKDAGQLKLLWRLSAATGIPRQGWHREEIAKDTPAPPAAPPGPTPTKST
jgi:hypothetical protein